MRTISIKNSLQLPLLALLALASIISCGKKKKDEITKTSDQVTMEGAYSCNYPNKGICIQYGPVTLDNKQLQTIRNSCTNPSNAEGVKGNFNTNLSCPTNQRIQGVCRIHSWMKAYFYTTHGTAAEAETACNEIDELLKREVGSSISVSWVPEMSFLGRTTKNQQQQTMLLKNALLNATINTFGLFLTE